MDAWIEVHEGSTAGAVHRLGAEPVTIGRHGDAELRLDPERDLSVSGRHAVLIPVGDGWMIRDLGSTNGTSVNDAPVEADRALADGDRIRLGSGGPVLIFRTGSRQPATVRTATAPGGETPKRRFPRLAVAVSLVSLAVLSSVFYLAGRLSTRREWEHERATLEARMDSILSVAQTRVADLRSTNDSLERNSSANMESLQLRVSGLLQALQQSEGEVRSLRASLTAAKDGGLDDSVVTNLRQRLQTVSVALERQQLAAALDFKTIESVTRRATAQIYVEVGTQVVTGTAFGVASTGILMTSRHVVLGPDGSEHPKRIGVQFADSKQVWPAHLLRVSKTADLALVQVERLDGPIPTVLGFNARTDTLTAGMPVAMMGFPLGGRPPEGSAGVIRPLLTAGVLSVNRGDLLELQGYGERGASGSPVLDGDGRVIGILVGGTESDAGRMLFAVPASDALRLLAGG